MTAFILPNIAFSQQSELIRHQIFGYRDGMAMVYDVDIPGNFDVNNEYLGILGINSGGHLASLLGTAIDSEMRSVVDFKAIVAIMPIVDARNIDPDESLLGAKQRDFYAGLVPMVAPVTHVSQDDPPTLLIHGTRDRVVDFEQNSLQMDKLPTDFNIENRLFAVDAGHEICSTTVPGPDSFCNFVVV